MCVFASLASLRMRSPLAVCLPPQAGRTLSGERRVTSSKLAPASLAPEERDSPNASCSLPVKRKKGCTLRGTQVMGRGWVGKGPVAHKARLVPSVTLTFMKNCIGRFVASQRLLGQVLVALGQALHLSKTGVQGHGGMGWIFGHVQVGSSPELLFDHQRLLQQLPRESSTRA